MKKLLLSLLILILISSCSNSSKDITLEDIKKELSTKSPQEAAKYLVDNMIKFGQEGNLKAFTINAQAGADHESNLTSEEMEIWRNATKESISQRQEEYQKAVMNVAQVYEKASPEEKAEADKFFAR